MLALFTSFDTTWHPGLFDEFINIKIFVLCNETY